MRIREAELSDATAMARVSVESYRAAHRDHIPEQSLMQFTYAESERDWARTLRELSASADREEYIYVAELDTGDIIGAAMGGPVGSNHPLYTPTGCATSLQQASCRIRSCFKQCRSPCWQATLVQLRLSAAT